MASRRPPAAAGASAADAATAPPPAFEMQAPDAWRAIDFISDLHLAEDMPRTFAAWQGHLLRTPADAVFILGDLFEVWVGDDARHRAFGRRCADVLAEASRQRTLAIMVGNRDFLLGAEMLREGGAIGLPDPTVLCAWGQRLLLTHGDALCLADEPYMAFRREVRSPAWQQAFLARPLDERMRIAAEIRHASKTRQQFDGNLALDIDAAEAVRWMRQQATPEMVHGHTHRPGSSQLAPGYRRHVLSDWDLDHDAAVPRAEVLRLTRGGLVRVAPATP